MSVNAHLHVVVDDTVFVIDDLSFVAELDRFTEATFANRTGVGVMR